MIADRPAGAEGRPVAFSPCFECKLCVAACPVGAILPDGGFNFSSCYTHNYREFMGGFTDWVETVADSKSARDYRGKVSDAETVSMWQSLSFGANYKAANCVAVCPAGEDVIGPFLQDRREHLTTIVKPLQEKAETVCVVPGTDAESCVAKRFPHKKPKRVKNGVRVPTVRSFLDTMVHVFQRGRVEGLDATYHFTFSGEETWKATVEIRDQEISVQDGHAGEPDVAVKADSRTWVRFLAGEKSLAVALLTRRVRVRGSLRLLLTFGRCLPGGWPAWERGDRRVDRTGTYHRRRTGGEVTHQLRAVGRRHRRLVGHRP